MLAGILGRRSNSKKASVLIGDNLLPQSVGPVVEQDHSSLELQGTNYDRETRNLEDRGFHRAAASHGSLEAYELSLSQVARETTSHESKNRALHLRQKEELTDENIRLRAELNQPPEDAAVAKQKTSTKIDENKATIKQLSDDIAKIQENPEQALQGEPEFSWANFVMGLIIQTGLTLYLFLFYTSASFTAFFSNIGVNLQNVRAGSDVKAIFNSIFNVRAIAEASQSWYTLLLILTFTFIFLGLGFLIHQFFKIKKYPVLASLLLVTFMFDGLIAYQITSKLHEAKYIVGLTETRWESNMIWSDVNFYLVLFAGFVVYVIWGVLLFFVLQEHEKREPARLAIRAKKEQINRLSKEIRRCERELRKLDKQEDRRRAKLQAQIEFNNARIEQLNNRIAMRVVHWDDVVERLDTFTVGWLRYLVQSNHATGNETERVKRVLDEFKQRLRATFTLQEGGL